MGHYIGDLGQPSNVEAALADGPKAENVLQWQLEKGVLVMPKELGKSDEPSLLWLAGEAE